PEAKVLEALEIGHRAIQPIIAMINELTKLAGKKKIDIAHGEVSGEMREAVERFLGTRFQEALFNSDKTAREDATRALRKEVQAQFAEQYSAKELGGLLDKLEKEIVRRNILENGMRPDGRGLREIRPISIDVGVLPRTHGTGLFQRGQTQV